MVPAVYGVGQKQQDEHLPTIEVDGSNETIGVTLQVEDNHGSSALNPD
jgi:hypothetical protein